MTDGATYHASVGPDLYGRTHRARAKVPEGVRRFFDRILTAASRDGGDRGGNRGHAESECTFTWTRDGSRVEIRCRDTSSFGGDLIRTRTPSASCASPSGELGTSLRPAAARSAARRQPIEAAARRRIPVRRALRSGKPGADFNGASLYLDRPARDGRPPHRGPGHRNGLLIERRSEGSSCAS
jgi:hypothetical protein